MIKAVLAGQPNCGKSTVFNMISGLKQKIANYPGVTVDKKSGSFEYKNEKIEIIDLPGTYSFSSYSLEEKVAKEAILSENPDLIINVVDASNLKRNLYLTFQLLEIGKPVILIFNMMDVATRRGMQINTKEISKVLKCPIIEASGANGIGKEEILNAIISVKNNEESYEEFKIDYENLESFISEIQNEIPKDSKISSRWLAIKALEKDKSIYNLIIQKYPILKEKINSSREIFESNQDQSMESFLAGLRYNLSELIFSDFVEEHNKNKLTLTDKTDKIVLNRWLAFPILFAIIFLVYELAIVLGYKLTDYTWPILAGIKNFAVDILPAPNIADIPLLTDFGIWMVNSANALLNYIPIFFILFALIAIMEDVGYMPRIAFILDRIFRKFGLHGQSTLPLVLGGAFVGGCAVPGIMSTKGIADDRARMATIMSVPLMNCLAKVPFYTLLLGAFFPNDMTIMMFFVSTITIFTALLIAKFLTSTILKSRRTAPFVMELPPYHLPTFRGVISRAFERVWMYMKKVITIVLAVAVVLFSLLEFPGLNKERIAYYDNQTNIALNTFKNKISKSSYAKDFESREEISTLLNFYDNYKSKKMVAGSAGKKVDIEFKNENPNLYKFLRPKKDKDAKIINKSLRKLSKSRNKILRQIKNEKVENSLLGWLGKSIEPVSKYAGFDWKINVAFLSTFAARESAVATLGSLYENHKADNQRAEKAMAENSGYTPLHATAIIIFMLLTPPCLAAMIVIKLQTNSYKWMIFAILFPISLGIIMSALVFTLGNYFNLDGLRAMTYYYFSIVILTFIVGFFPSQKFNFSGGFNKK